MASREDIDQRTGPGTGLVSWVTGRYDERDEPSADRRRRYRPLRFVVSLIAFLLIIYLAALVFRPGQGTAAFTIVLACSAVGMLLGFLFAIPKRKDIAIINAGASDPPPGAPPPAGGGSADAEAAQSAGRRNQAASAYSPNTSLEEISDWLTKIVVGIGLVQAREIGGFIQTQGAAMAPILFGANAPPLLGSAMLVATTVFSFLASYLYFRLSLARAFAESDKDADEVARAQAFEARANFDAALQEDRVQVAARDAAAPGAGSAGTPAADLGAAAELGAAGAGDGQATTATGLEAVIQQKLDKIRNNPIYPGDPVKGLFGGRPSADAPRPRSLTAKVKAVPGMKKWFQIELNIASAEPKLAGDIIVFLHPTFRRPYDRLQARNGQAAVTLYAYGAFTVGVLADDGATELELDLADLPDAPKLFRES